MTIGGQYALKLCINRGAQGKIYQGKHIDTDKDLIFKIVKLKHQFTAKDVIRELVYLRLLRDSPRIVKLIDIEDEEYKNNDKEVWMIFEKMETDLK